jgi:hypothetical protein
MLKSYIKIMNLACVSTLFISDFLGPDWGPRFGPSPNWKFPNIFPISDLKIPNHYQNYKKKKKEKEKKEKEI